MDKCTSQFLYTIKEYQEIDIFCFTLKVKGKGRSLMSFIPDCMKVLQIFYPSFVTEGLCSLESQVSAARLRDNQSPQLFAIEIV